MKVVPKVGWELDRLACRTEDGECEYKVDNTDTTVHARTEDVVVLHEPILRTYG